MIKKAWLKFIFSILSVLVLFFIAVPIIKLIFGSNPEVLLNTVKEKKVYMTILLTFSASLMATILALIGGIPLAYILARKNFPGKNIIEGLINIPVIIPHTAAGIALLTVFGNNFFLGRLFQKIGIKLVGHFSGIVIAMMFVSIPFLVNEVIDGFRAIDEKLEKVSRTLGASPAQTFFKIALPLNYDHILTGSLLMWARGVSEFGAVVIMAYHPMTAPVLIYERFTSYGLKYTIPVAAIMVTLSLLVFTIIRYLNSS